MSSHLPSIASSFTEQFINQSKFKLLGSGRGIISQCEAQTMISFFRGTDPASVKSSDHAVSLLQGKSKPLLMALLTRAENDPSIRNVLSGIEQQQTPPPQTPPESKDEKNKEEEQDESDFMQRADTARTEISMAWTEGIDSEDEDGWVMFGYMSDEDCRDAKQSRNDDEDEDDDDLSSNSDFGIVGESLSSSDGCWSSSVGSTPQRSPQPESSAPNPFRARKSLPVRRNSRRIELGPWLTVPQTEGDNDDCQSVMSDTSVLLYSPADTPPPPSCAILTELYIHSAKSRRRI